MQNQTLYIHVLLLQNLRNVISLIVMPNQKKKLIQNQTLYILLLQNLQNIYSLTLMPNQKRNRMVLKCSYMIL